MRLYVIGNGFDLAHNIECSYSHFEKYVCLHDSALYDVIGEYFHGGATDIWTDFEKALGEININRIYKIEHAEHLSQPEDFDSKNINMMIDVIHWNCKLLESGFHQKFREWVMEIIVPSVDDLDILPFALDSNACFLTFNYTDTLQKLYGINDSQILHIHNTTNDPIFGHAASKCISFANPEEEWFVTDDAELSIRNFFDKTRKPVNEIISKHQEFFNSLSNLTIDEVHVIGHSLNDIDLPYLEKVVACISNKAQWIISCFGNTESDLKRAMTKLNVHDFLIVKSDIYQKSYRM